MRPIPRWRLRTMTTKDFIVSADGASAGADHAVQGAAASRISATSQCGRRSSRSSRWSRTAPTVSPQAAHAGLRRMDGLPLTARRADRTPEGDPEIILEDMDADGVDAQVLHPNLSQFGLFTDHHEMSIAHAAGLQRLRHRTIHPPYFDRLAPTAPIPLTDIGDAITEVQRVAAGGFRAVLLPATAPLPGTTRRELDPLWADHPGHRDERVLRTPRPAASRSTTRRRSRSR